MKPLLLLTAAYFLTANAFGQNCESVIALSKTTSTQVSDKGSLDQRASSFCSEYSSSKKSGSSMNAGGSYGPLSASVGMSDQSAEAVASKYCSSDNASVASTSAFKSYVESISANAYPAYEQCLALSKNDLKFSVDTAAILPDEFSISATFVSTAGLKNTRVEISPSTGVTCRVNGRPEPQSQVEINTATTAAINCKRTDRSIAAYVRFVNSIGTPTPLTLPWQACTQQGIPVDTFFALEKRIGALERRGHSQSGTIALKAVGTRPITDGGSCPSGSDATRGERNGRITFLKPFAAPPVVAVGVTSVDAGITALNSGLRFTISVNKNGFTYSLYTWCFTNLAGASANWMAVLR